MSQQDGFIGLPRGAIGFVPLLVLPTLLGGLVLLVAPNSGVGQGAIIFATIAMAWYVLGGAISLRYIFAALAMRRALAVSCRQIEGIEVPVWLSDASRRILGRNSAARGSHDVAQSDTVEALLGQFVADTTTAAHTLLGKAYRGRRGEIVLTDGRRLCAEPALQPGLVMWSLCDAPVEPDEVPVDAPVTAQLDEFDALPVALLRLGADGAVLRANAAACDLVPGIEAVQHLGALLDGPGRPLGDWVADAASGRGTGAQAQMLRLRAGDADRYCQVTLHQDAGGTGELLAVLSDGSAMKTLEAQFVQSQKMQAIGQLAGGVAHDFNNLLTAISGHCDLLMLRHDKSDPDYADLDQISQNANRAAALVGQLLAFSRKQTLKPTVLDVRDTLSDLSHLLNRLVGERIQLSMSPEHGLKPIRADKRQLEQVIMNLVVNARDAMPDGGSIEVRGRNIHLSQSLKRDRATLAPGDYVAIEVRDEGVGIAPDHLAKIFEPFFTTKRVGEGTGLGLSTAYGIVKQTGGFIFCDSERGRGTVFSLYFPVFEGQVSAPDPIVRTQLSPEPDVPNSATVLLVEDEAPVRAFAARALKLKGFAVLEADSAEEALDILSDDQIEVDVFVTDVVMPGMDGPSWVRSALKDRPQTRVVFVSGYTEDVFGEGHVPIEHSVFLPKPFSLSELTDTVEQQLRGDPAGNTLH